MPPRIDLSAGGMFAMEIDKQLENKHLDTAKKDTRRLEYENNQLRAEVKKLQVDKDAIHSALDEVHDSLEDTNAELEITRQQLAIKCKELEDCRQNTYAGTQDFTSGMSRELEHMRMDMQLKDEAIAAKDAWCRERIEEMRVECDAKLRIEEENIRVLEAKHENELASEQKASQRLQEALQRSENGVEEVIKQLKQTHEGDLKAEREASQELLAAQHAQVKQLEEVLNLSKKLELDLGSSPQEITTTRASSLSIQQASQFAPSVSETYLKKQLEEAQALHSTELSESRHLTQFFKNNSERLSREVRELQENTRRLVESCEAKDREIEDQLAHIYALRME
ncbi:hypothetical protein B0O99DRAFT_645853 [Bisporella sp. PMI_857]|nr:hypothetical protein B0O99DRAFT_645853 [Bisporella sp. PMI_857]